MDTINDYLEHVSDFIPGGYLTASKSPRRFPSVYPKYVAYGKGCYLYDINHEKYIDYVSGLGTSILGYAYPKVVNEVKKAVDRGNLYSLESTVHFELAELLKEAMPNAEKSKFFLNGSDATAAAVKVARTYTNRSDVVMFKGNYHGNNDMFTIHQDINYGVPDSMKSNSIILDMDIDKVKTFFEECGESIACVITEPQVYECSSDWIKREKFLLQVRSLCRKYGSLFILDEIVTHLRYSHEGFTTFNSDLTCIGKAMSGGYPISGLVGKTEIIDMFDVDTTDKPCFYSGSFHGHEIGAVAAKTVIEECIDKSVNVYIFKQGEKLKNQFNNLTGFHDIPMTMIGMAPRMIIKYNDGNGYTANELKSLFLQESGNLGLFCGNIIYIGYQHTDKIINQTIEILDDTMDIIKTCIEQGTVAESIIGEKCCDLVLRKV